MCSSLSKLCSRLRAGRAPDRTALSAAYPEIAPWLARRLALVELLYSVSQEG